MKPPRTESHVPVETTGNLPEEQDDEKKESDYADEFEFNHPLLLEAINAKRKAAIATLYGSDPYNANKLIPNSTPSVIDPRD